MPANFVHLHNHSHYSLLDALSKFDDMIAKAKEYGMPAIALTDHGNMYGAIEFYQACTKAGIKPIIGVEVYVAVRSRFDKEPNIDSKRYHLTLLAKNEAGYRNLLKIVTAANLEGYYYKPRVDKQLLRDHAEGIICLSGCMASELGRTLWGRDMEMAEKIIREYQDIFGKDNYYLEISHQANIERQLELKEAIIKLARKLDIPLVATQDCHYPNPEDAEAHETLIGIQQGHGDGKRISTYANEDFSFASPEKMAEKFADTPEALENTVKIADQCNLELEMGKFVFPNFPIPEGETADSLLKKLAYKGLEFRKLDKDQESIDRLEYELGIIAFKGYASYFLIVEDLIRFAREREIYYNIRGSVAGSITTYALDITKVNPIEYKIPFERFLNPERPSAPDIDMDFADNRRDEIIDYARHKYGEDKVAQIGTFGTMAARGSVRDVARALNYPYATGDQISKLIPMGSQGVTMTIAKALKETPELKELYDTDTDAKRIIDMAQKIEGSARHISVHAAGVVISPGPLTDYTPLQYDPKGKTVITQYDMYAVGEDGVGLTKFDFLGLRNLAILSNALTLANKLYGDHLDIETIPVDDAKTFEMLARGETEGLFQLNGAGMTKWLKELRPSNIHDINAMVALYRPGPMQFIPDYIDRKHHPKKIKYLDPSLEPILKQTYGILVYQDDLLMMAVNLAGYSWGKVDKFRKAVGKKIPELMAQQREEFIKGCIEHSGWSEKKATEIWAWLEPFAAYGFNKAHSASYGRVAYQTAYMKANFPIVYMTACLTAESGDIDQVAIYVNECKRMGVPVLPPDINESFGDFTVVLGDSGDHKDDKIRFGLYTIKNLGKEIADAIVAERKRGGPYKNFIEFLDRVHHKNLNKKSLESLIKAGAFDSFNEERGRLINNMEDALNYNKDLGQDVNQDSLFGLMADKSTLPVLKLKDCEPVSQMEKLAWEKELLGLYVTGHPLDRFKEKFEKVENNIAHLKTQKNNSAIVAAGIIEEVKPIVTKNNDRMAFVRLADFSGSIEAVVFPRIFNQFKELLVPEQCVAIRGKLSIRNNEPSIIIEAIKEL